MHSPTGPHSTSGESNLESVSVRPFKVCHEVGRTEFRVLVPDLLVDLLVEGELLGGHNDGEHGNSSSHVIPDD